MLVVDLGKWMNKILIDWGIDPEVADRFDETIIAILMIAIAVGLNYLCQAILSTDTVVITQEPVL